MVTRQQERKVARVDMRESREDTRDMVGVVVER